MPRSSLVIRVPAPFRLSPVVSEIVVRLRSADPEAQWSFERTGGGLALWLRSTDEVLARATRRLPWAAEVAPYPPAAAHVTDQDVDCVIALSQLSSDFAMSLLRAGELPDQTRRDVAVQHVAAVAGLLSVERKSPFLFHCWQHWSRNLTPFERVDLYATARETPPAGATFEDCPPEWSEYLATIREILGSRLDTATYLLFDHAHRTHHRLGIDERAEALAALVVRQAVLSPAR